MSMPNPLPLESPPVSLGTQSTRQGWLWVSYSTVAIYGLAITISGITYASVFFGAQSLPYYISALAGAVLTLPHAAFCFTGRSGFGRAVTLAVLSPIILFLLQALLLSFTWEEFESSFEFAVSLSFVLYISLTAGSLPANKFQRLMFILSLAHILILVYGIVDWVGGSAAISGYRFGVAGVATAAWAEFAIGTIIAGLISGNRLAIIVASILAAYIVVSTQMRGAGLAVFALVFTYWFFVVLRRRNLYLLYLLLAAVSMVLIFLSSALWDFIATALLLNDHHRGIEAGFSGRLENWQIGWERFLSSPLVGVGAVDDLAGYTHNGYLKVFAQYGLVGGGLFLGVLAVAMSRTIRTHRKELIAAGISYLVYLVSAPRFLNLQVMPLVATSALAAGFLFNKPLAQQHKK